MDFFLEFGDEGLVVLAFFEIVDGFGEFLYFFHEVFIFLGEKLVFLCQGFVIKLDEVDVDSYLFALENVLAFALQFLSKEIIFLDNFLSVLMKIIALRLNFLDFLFKEGNLMLIGHEEGLNIIQLLKHFGVVDFRDVLRGPQLLYGQARFLAHY